MRFMFVVLGLETVKPVLQKNPNLRRLLRKLSVKREEALEADIECFHRGIEVIAHLVDDDVKLINVLQLVSYSDNIRLHS